MPRPTIPLLPLRDIIVFPHQVVPLFVGREKSIAALEEAMEGTKRSSSPPRSKAKTNDPGPEDIYTVGTIATIIQLLRLPDGTVKVLVEGKRRARIGEFLDESRFFSVAYETRRVEPAEGLEVEALVRSVQSAFEVYVKLNKRIPAETLSVVNAIDDPSKLADTIVFYLTLKLSDKQDLLESTSTSTRLERLFELMQAEIEILQVEKKIRTRVKKQMEKTQKEYYLNEQMQAIQKELGERDEFKSELQELEEKLEAKKLPQRRGASGPRRAAQAQDDVADERRGDRRPQLHRLDARAAVGRASPTTTSTSTHAERVLDEDHYGLTKVKERIDRAPRGAGAREAPKAPSCAWSARPASARRRSRDRSRAP
jgi:ATP-dependent Lon protease